MGLPNNGFVAVATISPASTVADPAHNARLVEDGLRRAAAEGANIVAFPEVTLTSYIADDLLYHSILLESAERELGRLVRRTADLDVLYSVGTPLCINGKIYNTVAVCHRGRILGVVPKTFIPTYGVDFEGRWFQSGPAEVTDITVAGFEHVPFGSHQLFRCRELPQLCVGYEICEDIWSPDPPSIKLALAGATIICNGSASNASLEKDLYRRGLISGQSARLLCCYAYCSSGQGDSTGDVTVGGQEIIAENGSVLAQAQPFGEGHAIADADVESLWCARRGMSSFHVAASAQAAGYHETVFSMEIAEHPLLRPVSKQPFVPANERDLNDCCDLGLTMQAHGMLAFLHNRGANQMTVLAEDTAVKDAALALIAAVKTSDLAQIDRTAVRVQFSGEKPNAHAEALLDSLAAALGCTVFDAGQPSIANPNGALINPVDMTELALGISDFPIDLSMQYAVNSQLARSFVPLMLARVAQTTSNERLHAALGPIIEHDDVLHVPEHDPLAARGFADIAPAEVEDFYIDGFLRAQYRPSKSFRLAQRAFGTAYSDHELLNWMRTFYGRFFATQFMRHDLPDGPRIGSAGLDLRDGFMMPTVAQNTLWIDEVDELLAQFRE
ncbi:nitrilase-related carbon-nitrogen hydrolase [Bifidobacterium anseris]|nr:nitrilase-related carbon-nitrogen hydrolase [Bifidobacterium anseris]